MGINPQGTVSWRVDPARVLRSHIVFGGSVRAIPCDTAVDCTPYLMEFPMRPIRQNQPWEMGLITNSGM